MGGSPQIVTDDTYSIIVETTNSHSDLWWSCQHEDRYHTVRTALSKVRQIEPKVRLHRILDSLPRT